MTNLRKKKKVISITRLFTVVLCQNVIKMYKQVSLYYSWNQKKKTNFEKKLCNLIEHKLLHKKIKIKIFLATLLLTLSSKTHTSNALTLRVHVKENISYKYINIQKLCKLDFAFIFFFICVEKLYQ